MPRVGLTIRVLGVAAVLVAALGLGLFLGTPDTAFAQEDTTTTVVDDSSTPSTVVDDHSTDTTVDQSTDRQEDGDRSAPADDDCGDRADDGSATESSSAG